MQALRLNHPYPTFTLPDGIDPDSADSVRRFVSQHRFPSPEKGRYLFAYVDEQEQFEVWLRHKLAGHRQPQRLIRCAAGIHLLQMEAPAVNRVEYHFELVDGDGDRVSVSDPLNTASVRDPFGKESVIAAPDYRPSSYANEPPPDARGSLDETVIEGPLGKPWPTWIWSPPTGWGDDREALPVIVFLDGGDWLQLASARNILENLVHVRAIAPCCAVFLKPAARNEEYAANPRTAEFLADDLPRSLAEHMPWPQEAQQRIAVGVSLGALCLLHTHFTQPRAFGKLILQSGSFFQPQTDAMETGYPFFKRICGCVSGLLDAASKVARIPIHMTCGAGEENIINNRAMAQSLREQGFPITFHEQPDAHNWTCWRDSIGDGLKHMIAP